MLTAQADPLALVAMAFTLGSGIVAVAVWAQGTKSKVDDMRRDVDDHEARLREVERWQDSRDGFERGKQHRTGIRHRAVREDSRP